MARRRAETTLDTFGDRIVRTPTIEMLQGIVWGLNTPILHYPPVTRQPPLDMRAYNHYLRTLIERWKESGPNLEQLFARYPSLKEECSRGTTELLISPTGRAWLDWKPDPKRLAPDSWEYAATCHFVRFIVNPHGEKLGGPCVRCQQYFIKRRKSQNKYCSRKCAASSTAVSSTRSRRKELHEAKVEAAQAQIERFLKSGSRQNWKRWIARKGDISVSWLTRAVNGGWIVPPKSR